MSKVWCYIAVLSTFVCHVRNLNSTLCQMTPREKHCLIEHAVKDQWPHTLRYVYNWYTRNCFEIRWSDYCPAIRSPPITNNFRSQQECLDECGSWT